MRSVWVLPTHPPSYGGKRHAPGFRYNLATLADVQLQTFDLLALRNLNGSHLAPLNGPHVYPVLQNLEEIWTFRQLLERTRIRLGSVSAQWGGQRGV